MEALRYRPWLKPEGWLVTNSVPIPSIADYPDPVRLQAALAEMPHRIVVDAVGLARAEKSPRSVNMAVLGAASPCMPFPEAVWEEAIREQFSRKGAEVVEANIRVFQAGRTEALRSADTPKKT